MFQLTIDSNNSQVLVFTARPSITNSAKSENWKFGGIQKLSCFSLIESHYLLPKV